jgi:hypothetical protein
MPINGCCCTTTCCATILIQTAHDYVNLQQTDATNWSDSDCSNGSITLVAAVGMTPAYWELTYTTVDGSAIYSAPLGDGCPPMWEPDSNAITNPWTFVSSTPNLPGGEGAGAVPVEPLASVTCGSYSCCDPLQVIDQTSGNLWLYSQTSCGVWTTINATGGSIVKRNAAENSNKYLLTLPNGQTYYAANQFCPPTPSDYSGYYLGWSATGGSTHVFVMTCPAAACYCKPHDPTAFSVEIPASTTTLTHSTQTVPAQTFTVTGSCVNSTAEASPYPGQGNWASSGGSGFAYGSSDNINTTGFTGTQLAGFHYTIVYDFPTISGGVTNAAGTTYYARGLFYISQQSGHPISAPAPPFSSNSLTLQITNLFYALPSGTPPSSGLYFTGGSASCGVVCSTYNSDPTSVPWPPISGAFYIPGIVVS